MLIKSNEVLNISEGFNTFEIDTNDNLDLDLNINLPCNLFIRILNASKINIKATISNNVSILFWNETDKDIETNEYYDVIENGSFNLSYGECNSANTKRSLDVNLIDENTNCLVSSASLIDSKKNYRINVVCANKKTIGNIKNYAVVLNKGSLIIDAIGKINKGSKKAQSHQTSRALSFESGQNTTILPELLIDENDVQASHAMSIGRVDEKDLYYMMSRGLSMNQCTKLISLGYLLPITDSIQDEKLKNTLQEQLERKISERC